MSLSKDHGIKSWVRHSFINKIACVTQTNKKFEVWRRRRRKSPSEGTWVKWNNCQPFLQNYPIHFKEGPRGPPSTWSQGGPEGTSRWPKATSPLQELEVGGHRLPYLLVYEISKMVSSDTLQCLSHPICNISKWCIGLSIISSLLSCSQSHYRTELKKVKRGPQHTFHTFE